MTKQLLTSDKPFIIYKELGYVKSNMFDNANKIIMNLIAKYYERNNTRVQSILIAGKTVNKNNEFVNFDNFKFPMYYGNANFIEYIYNNITEQGTQLSVYIKDNIIHVDLFNQDNTIFKGTAIFITDSLYRYISSQYEYNILPQPYVRRLKTLINREGTYIPNKDLLKLM